MKRLFDLLKLYTRPDFWPILTVIVAALLAGRGLMGEGYFNMHDDLQMMRQLEMEKCFLDLQIPCRWVPDMGYGFGYPLFNYYPPLPYLVGQGIRLLGFAFTDTAKILFILSFVVSGLTMYMLAKEFFGRIAGTLSAVFYIWAPYHAVDVYVRGAMNESWGLMWFPLILWSGYRLIIEKKNNHYWILVLSLSWFALFTSHNLMVLIFGPVFALWLMLWMFVTKNWNKIPQLALAGIWSFGLAAFFTLPVFMEKGIVQTNTLVKGYYEYTAHFVSIPQLFTSRFWGYGPSVWNTTDDGMPFQIGWPLWGTAVLVGIFILLRLYKAKKIDPVLLPTIYMLLIGGFATFMTHNKSTPIWQAIKPLEFVQFPWRFLTITILGLSFSVGYIESVAPKALKAGLVSLLIAFAIGYSFNYFKPEHGKLGPLTDNQKFTAAAWDLQQTAGIYDYLPNTAKTAPKAPQVHLAEIVKGEGVVTTAIQGTDWGIVKLDLAEDSMIRLGILQFPDWQVRVDGVLVNDYVSEDEQWGRIYFDAPKGEHTVEINLKSTPPRTIGNVVSTLSWLLVLGSVVELKQKKKVS